MASSLESIFLEISALGGVFSVAFLTMMWKFDEGIAFKLFTGGSSVIALWLMVHFGYHWRLMRKRRLNSNKKN